MFTSDSQHPPRSKHAVYLGGNTSDLQIKHLHNMFPQYKPMLNMQPLGGAFLGPIPEA